MKTEQPHVRPGYCQACGKRRAMYCAECAHEPVQVEERAAVVLRQRIAELEAEVARLRAMLPGGGQ